MTTSTRSTIAAALLVAAATLAACSSATQSSSSSRTAPTRAPQSPAELAKADGGYPPYTRADTRFMQGMIGHHAQAIVMARWAPTHGAGQSLQILASRIAVAQGDEIAYMQRWLSERHEMVPDANASHDMAGHNMSMPGMAMGDTLMPGMLSPEQMKQLDAAKGADFDRLFLTFMIQHHMGALTMVEQLFATPGSGQEGLVWRFAADVDADQSTEIRRMQSMLTQADGKRP